MSNATITQQPAKHTDVKAEKPASLWSDAWYDLRRNKVFLIGALLALILILVSAFPQLFSHINAYDPATCDLKNARKGITSEHWFGTDNLGCDTYSRVIYGARVSILVGIITTVITTVVGGGMGLVAGFFGHWSDILLSRLAEVFFAIPPILGALLILSVIGRDSAGVGTVVMALAVLYWPLLLRIMRAAVISAKSQDFVVAARALGASSGRIMLRHILPNAVAPVIVTATLNLGAFIAAE